MKLKHFIATVCFALCVISAKGESMTQQQALSIVKSYYGSRDVDYYLCSDYNGWRIFVDEDPLKGWEHDCAVYTFPGPNNWTGDPNPTIQLLRLPPDETLVPIIKSATPTVMVNDYIDIEFKNEIFSDETTIFVKSVDQTYSMSEINVPAGVKSIRINTSSLPNGLYVLALVVNGQIVDNLKFDK